ADGVAKETLTPEEPLAAFIGEDPNGTWTITISDDFDEDGGTLTQWDLIFQTAAPAVLKVDTTAADGTYVMGDIIPIEVTFSEPVFVTGTPQLMLGTGATDAAASYAGGRGTNTLLFKYQVAGGVTASDLDYASTSALVLNDGTITTAAGDAADLTLVAPGLPGSLAANADLVVVKPTLTVTAGDASRTYGV